jgi:hypothetical protein
MTPATDAPDLQRLEPDPLEPDASEVERYVSALQELASSKPDLARRQAWRQIRLAGKRAAGRRPEALDSLNRMFRLGVPPEPAIDGPHRGILVTTTVAAAADPAVRMLASAWMPWVGKRLSAAEQSGDNLLLPSARIPLKILFPSYEPQPAGDGDLAAFRFRTYVEPGKVDPDRQALKIDYDSDENPSLLIRDILDELVQIVPGAYLGKVLLRRGGQAAPTWRLVGYFALEPPETVKAAEPVAVAVEPAPAPA